MSNAYIEAICTLPKENMFGYDAYANLSMTQKSKVGMGIVRPESTVGYRWHYAKEAAKKLSRFGTPQRGKYTRATQPFYLVKRGWSQYSLPPTSTKSAYYQGALAAHALRLLTGIKDLGKTAAGLYSKGDTTKYSASSGAIQSAAKDAYKKIVFRLKKHNEYSKDPIIRGVLNHIRGYSKLSEISFGKKLSVESSSDLSDVMKNQVKVDKKKKEEVDKEIKEVKKKRGLDVTAKVKMPFKNKSEGNKFRGWVNDNHRRWAKKADLSRSGSYTNSYMRKAWKRFGQEYTEWLAQEAFLERKNDDLPPPPVDSGIQIATTPIMPVQAKMISSASASPFEEAPVALDDEDPEVGMMQLLQDDPGEWIKKYWYVPTAGVTGILGIALVIRLATK